MMMEHQLSSQFELGSLQKTYRGQGMWMWFLAFILITISISLLVLLNGLDYLAFLIPMALLFILVLVWVLYLDRRSIRISVYEEGFVYKKLSDHKVILWSEIGSITHGVAVNHDPNNIQGPSHTYKFYKKDGEILLTLTFDGSWQGRMRKVVEMIEQATTAILAPPIQEAYRQGKNCPFGVITLSLGGVTFREKMLSWNEVKSFVIGVERIQIKTPSDNFWKMSLNVPLEKVDNVEVMRMLVEVAASTYHFEMPKRRAKK